MDIYDCESGIGNINLEQATKAQRGGGGEKYSCTLYLTSALEGVGGQRHAPAVLLPGEPGAHCVGGWVGSRLMKISPLWGLDSGPFARSESQYCLSYRGPYI
jgi:hypothetical protein